jgi:hypothetical protein
MVFTQQSFLGASVRNFNSHIGWGGSASTLSVELVEDPVLNQSFSKPTPGSPVLFEYNNWTFGGIVQSWKQTNAQDGNSTFSIEVVDPREMLNGVQLILDSYTGSVYNVPNMYNLFGYIESNLGFGSAGVNEGGMPWQLVRSSFLSLQTTSPIKLSTTSMYVDLSNLPNVSNFYRVSGPVISLMDFISDVCEAGGCDFFFRLLYVNNVPNLILYTINRSYTPVVGAIASFLNSLSSYNKADHGLEYRNETNNKFLIGGKVQKLFVQEADLAEPGERDGTIEVDNLIFPREADNTIMPYFGEKEDNTGCKIQYTPVNWTTGLKTSDLFDCLYDNNEFPQRDFDNGTVQNTFGENRIAFYHPSISNFMKGRGIFDWYSGGDTALYLTDINELRAAYASQDVWENFLFSKNHQDTIDYRDDKGNIIKIKNIHKGKFGRTGLNLVGLFNEQLTTNLDTFNRNSDTQGLLQFLENDFGMNWLMNSKTKAGRDANKPFNQDDAVSSIYSAIHEFANTYYGKQYMVTIPFVVGKLNLDEDNITVDFRGNERVLPGNKLVTSLEPSDGGYIDNVDYQIVQGDNGSEYAPLNRSEFAKMVNDKILPLDIRRFQTNDGRITAIARFAVENQRGEKLNISNVPDSEYVEHNGYYYVKCELKSELTFAVTSILFSPRAIIELPGIIGTTNGETRWQADMVKSYILQNVPNIYKAGQNNQTNTQIDDILRKKIGGAQPNGVKFVPVGSEFLNEDLPPFPIAPSLVIIPLKSNIYTYGPWYSIGGTGKTEVEVDEELVPWKYGSYDLMNQSAQARVSESAMSQQFGETGSIVIPDVPTVNIGELLIVGGPYLTDINVQIGEDGATTSYSFENWTTRFGQIPKLILDEQRKIRQLLKRQRGAIFNLAANNTLPGNKILAKSSKNKNPSRRIKSFSSHPFLTSEKVGQKNHIVSSPTYNASEQTANVENKNLASLDTLFVPFSTNYDASGIPHLEYPSGQTGFLNATGLNPFLYPHPFNAIMRDDDEWDQSFSIENSGLDDADGYRPFAIRMPAIFSGWGVDTNNKPVPANTGDPTRFADDYRTNVTKWKTGPLLTKWNDKAKGWEASGSALKRCQTTQNIPFNGSGLADIYEYVASSGKNIKNGSEWVYDWILVSGMTIPSHTKCIFYTEGDRNYIVNAACVVDSYPINY